jgi:hypothetical protein
MLGSRILWLMVFLIPVLGWSQAPDRFQVLLQSAASQEPQLAISKMDQFISDLRVKRGKLKSDEVFLRYTFREAHKTFFKNYKAYSQFPEIFESGNYDCLSATSFFSVVLDAFGFEYKIIETNYHIFMVVEGDQKQLLLESTDEINGIVTNEEVIKERLARYQENKMYTSSTGKYYYQYDLDLYQQVMPQQLTGLLYYNQAVTAFNMNDLVVCAQRLKKAIRIYNSPRIAEFAVILVSRIADSSLGEEEKKQLISPFASIIKDKAAIVASL